MRRGAAAGMARPAEKIAQLEAALEKKDQEIGVLKLTSRRLEEELNSLKALVEEGFDAAYQKTEEEPWGPQICPSVSCLRMSIRPCHRTRRCQPYNNLTSRSPQTPNRTKPQPPFLLHC